MSEDTAEARPGWRCVVRAWRRNPGWRVLYAARAISLLGIWFNTLVLVELLAGGETPRAGKTALALAVVFVLKQVPMTVLGPTAGVVADRYDRRRIMIGCELVSACVALCFLLLEPGGPALWVYLLTGLQMSVAAFFLPTYQASVPSLVRSDDLAAANVASSATWSVMFATGMAAGGLVMEYGGWRTAVVIDAVTYVASALLVWRIAYTQPPRERRELRGLAEVLGLTDMKEGLRYIAGTPEVRRVILVKFGWGSMGAITLFLTLLGTTELYSVGGTRTSGVSFLWGFRALGTLFGPLLAYRFAGSDPERLKRAITFAFFAAPLVYIAVPFAHVAWLGGALVLVAHLAGSTLWVISTVILQATVPDEFRGRTFAAELGLVMLSSSASLLAYAAVIDAGWLPLRWTVVAACGVCLVPAGLWLRGRSAANARAVGTSRARL